MSDHEEEFYYTEVEVSMDTVTKTFADMYTSSPSETSFGEASRSIQDHDYQKKARTLVKFQKLCSASIHRHPGER